MRVLVSGASSGLGREIFESFPGADRVKRPGPFPAYLHYETIVHAACDPLRDFNEHNVLAYIDSHLNLTRNMCEWQAQTFVFISSVDVYPKGDGREYTETTPFTLSSPLSLYGACKLAAEAIVREHTRRHLILRLPTLLGPYQRPNAITRVLKGEATLTLDRASVFNCVLTRDVIAFLKAALDKGVTGTFNVASTQNVRLEEVASNYDLEFGHYFYRCPQVSSEKAYAVAPFLRKTSREVIEQFKAERDLSERTA